jgi:hypothetical protein
MLPFYAYINQLFRRTLTPREGDGTKILAYNKNILAGMAPNTNGIEFSMFVFIWEEIKAISKSPLKSCSYAPYIMHMVERVTGRTFSYDKDHHPLMNKNDLRAPVKDRRTMAPRGSARMCKSQPVADVKAQHEKHARKKDTKSVKEIHSHLNLQPPRSPIASKGEPSPNIESFKKRIAQFDEETLVQ